MAQFTITHERVLTLRKLLAGFFPGIEHADLFSEPVVGGILNRLGQAREKSSLQSAQVAERHVLLLNKRDGVVGVSGIGVSEQGMYLAFSALWNEPGDDSFSGSLDPHALYYAEESDFKIESRESTGPVHWWTRLLQGNAGRAVKTRVRRLSDPRTAELYEDWNEEFLRLRALFHYDLLEDLEFFRALAALNELAANRNSSFSVSLKGRAAGQGVARLVSGWPLDGGGHGFLETFSNSSLPESTSVRLSFDTLRIWNALFERAKVLGSVELLKCDTGMAASGISLRTPLMVFNVQCDRERRGLESRETLDQAVGRTRAILKKASSFLPESWSESLHETSVLADAFQTGAQLAVPVVGQEFSSGLQIALRTEEGLGILLKARNGLESGLARLRKAEGAGVSLILGTALAVSSHKFLRAFAQAYSLKKTQIHVRSSEGAGLLALRHRHVTAGILFPDNPQVRILMGNPEPKPAFEIEVTDPSGLVKSLLILRLADLLREESGGVTTDATAFFSLLPDSLILESGDAHCSSGVRLERTGADAGSAGFKIPCESLGRILAFLQHAGQVRDLKSHRLFFGIAEQGREALFLRIVREEETVAKVSARRIARCALSDRHGMPDYTAVSPFWQTETQTLTPLPSDADVTALSVLQSGFRFRHEENMNPMRAALTGFYYKDGKFLGANQSQAVAWFDNAILGDDLSLLIPPGFFGSAAFLKRTGDPVSFGISGDTYRLESGGIHAICKTRIPAEGSDAYPVDLIARILRQDQILSPGADGIIPGLGPGGTVESLLPVSRILERLSSIGEEESYTRVAWLCDSRGRHQFVPDHQFGKELSFGAAMASEITFWETDAPLFFLMLNRARLNGFLKAFLAACAASDRPHDETGIRLRPTGIKVWSSGIDAVLLGEQMTDIETRFLRQIRELENG